MGNNCAPTPAGKWNLEPHVPKSGSVNGVCTRLTLRTYRQRAGNHRMGRRVGNETGYTHTVSRSCLSGLIAQGLSPRPPQKLTPQANPHRKRKAHQEPRQTLWADILSRNTQNRFITREREIRAPLPTVANQNLIRT